MEIRDNVKRLCKLRGITQKELASKIGISETSLNVSLKPDGNPSVKTIEKVATGLGVSVSQLLASPEELELLTGQSQEERGKVLRCPHCGEEIELYVKAL